ncbi:MAG: methyltransferase domain-containing protein [Propionibacteriales bacterium]|nr:methyltransferase domain-containing protein [Propionibacteriales bacterium]
MTAVTRGDDRVRAAFDAVQREDFLPSAERRYAADDRPLPIGPSQTNSQPSSVRTMLELLVVRAGDTVLDVGSGSGWTTALLGHLVGPEGRVVGVEVVERLAVWGRSNVEAYGMGWVSVQQADPDVLGLPSQAPFDRILVSAESRTLPAELVDQLTPEGRMVVPVHGRLSVVQRHRDREPVVRQVGHYRFVPLRRSERA